MTTRPFVFAVQRVTATNDGDTWRQVVQTTPDTTWAVVCRLYGYDCPETRKTRCGTCGRVTSAYELKQAGAALNWTRTFLAAPGTLWTQLELGTDSFGRQLTTTWHEIDDIMESLGESLADAGLASVWPTRWHEQYDPQRDRS